MTFKRDTMFQKHLSLIFLGCFLTVPPALSACVQKDFLAPNSTTGAWKLYVESDKEMTFTRTDNPSFPKLQSKFKCELTISSTGKIADTVCFNYNGVTQRWLRKGAIKLSNSAKCIFMGQFTLDPVVVSGSTIEEASTFTIADATMNNDKLLVFGGGSVAINGGAGNITVTMIWLRPPG